MRLSFWARRDRVPAPGAAEMSSRQAITDFLFVKHQPEPVDFAFVLGCPSIVNVEPAIDLYHRGYTKRLVISGHGPARQQPTEAEIYRAHAIGRGVPDEAIVLETEATNTRENFLLSSDLIDRVFGWSTVKSVAICGKPFHMRRALMTARACWPARLRLLMIPSNEPDDPNAETWWQTEHGRRHVLRELTAIGTYALEGHLGDI
jgi:uncharacterized SAM-binding protein YcdF (DUF218 family)